MTESAPVRITTRYRQMLALMSMALTAWLTLHALLNPHIPWDSWMYHLPFAAYLWDIGGGEHHYFMVSRLYYRFLGFPKLAEWLQGLGWVMTGSLRGIMLPNIALLGIWAAHARAYLRLPLAYMLPVVFAFPLITLQYQSGYIDFLACFTLAIAFNAALALLRLRRLKHCASVKRAWFVNLAFMCLAAAASGQIKSFAVPAALVMLGFMLCALWRSGNMPLMATGRLRIVSALLIVIFLPLVCWQQLHNTLAYQNPLYPVAFSVLNEHFPGPEIASSLLKNQPDYLPADVLSRPLLFFASITESDWLIRHIQPFHYSIGMSHGDQKGLFMRTGGLFAPYILVHLLCFFLLSRAALRLKDSFRHRFYRDCVLLFGALSVLIAFLPLNHELRYYLVWPVMLATCNGLLLRAAWPHRQEIVETGVFVFCVWNLTLLDITPEPWSLRYVDVSQSAFHAGIPADLRQRIDSASDIICLGPAYRPLQFRYSAAIVGGHHIVQQLGPADTCMTSPLP